MEKVKDKNTKRKHTVIIYVTSVILTSFLLSLVIMFLVNDTFALTAVPGSTEVYISEDVTTYKASKTLKESGLIDSRVWFTLYSRLRGMTGRISAGSYTVSNTGGYDGILNALKNNEH